MIRASAAFSPISWVREIAPAILIRSLSWERDSSSVQRGEKKERRWCARYGTNDWEKKQGESSNEGEPIFVDRRTKYIHVGYIHIRTRRGIYIRTRVHQGTLITNTRVHGAQCMWTMKTLHVAINMIYDSDVTMQLPWRRNARCRVTLTEDRWQFLCVSLYLSQYILSWIFYERLYAALFPSCRRVAIFQRRTIHICQRDFFPGRSTRRRDGIEYFASTDLPFLWTDLWFLFDPRGTATNHFRFLSFTHYNLIWQKRCTLWFKESPNVDRFLFIFFFLFFFFFGLDEARLSVFPRATFDRSSKHLFTFVKHSDTVWIDKLIPSLFTEARIHTRASPAAYRLGAVQLPNFANFTLYALCRSKTIFTRFHPPSMLLAS